MLLSTTHVNGAIVLQPCISAGSVGLHNEQSSGAEPHPKAPRPSTNRSDYCCRGARRSKTVAKLLGSLPRSIAQNNAEVIWSGIQGSSENSSHMPFVPRIRGSRT
jgi:hypothetical protein